MTDTMISGGSSQTTAGSTGATGDGASGSQSAQQTADAAALAAAATAAAATGTQEAAKTTEKVVPEKYEFKFEGESKLDSEIQDQLGGIAKELKLSQDEAQKIANLGPKLADKLVATQQAQFKTVVEGWANETRADKELGGDKLGENLAIAKKAVETFGTPALTKLLNESGLGNHPEVIRAFVKAGRALSQDTHVQADDRGNNAEALAKLYPNHPKSL